jgi:nuclease-like protein
MTGFHAAAGAAGHSRAPPALVQAVLSSAQSVSSLAGDSIAGAAGAGAAPAFFPEKAQPFGNRAKEPLSSLVFGQWVTVDGDKTDRYGRTVAKLLVAAPHAECRGTPACPRNLDANLAQLNLGMAWWYRQYAREQAPDDRRRYGQAEEDAQAQRAGLWREPNPVSPWEWRKQRREAPPQSAIASPAMATTGRR